MAISEVAVSENVVSSTEFTKRISELEIQNGGQIGVSVVSANGALLYSYRSNQKFAMCSTFKALLGASILSRVDLNLESLDRDITYASSDILDFAPITKSHLISGRMTVSQLSAASIQYSDNTASNLLLNEIGGPKALTAYCNGLV